MSFTTAIYFCLQCNNSAKTSEKIIHQECLKPMVIKATVNFEIKRPRWNRFLSWLFSRDISFGLAICGVIGINALLIQHLSFTITQSVIEGLCLGLAIPRLLK
jgi:hypothetical protein